MFQAADARKPGATKATATKTVEIRVREADDEASKVKFYNFDVNGINI